PFGGSPAAAAQVAVLELHQLAVDRESDPADRLDGAEVAQRGRDLGAAAGSGGGFRRYRRSVAVLKEPADAGDADQRGGGRLDDPVPVVVHRAGGHVERAALDHIRGETVLEQAAETGAGRDDDRTGGLAVGVIDEVRLPVHAEPAVPSERADVVDGARPAHLGVELKEDLSIAANVQGAAGKHVN